MQSPKKIHVVTKAYLANWAVDGLVRPVSVRYGRQKLRTPSGLAWQSEWWGANDPGLNKACEESCGKLETLLPDALASVEAEWPPDAATRAVLAQFMALHVVRTPAFVDRFQPLRDTSIAEYRNKFPSPEAYETWRRAMQSDRERANKLLSLINKLSTIIVSMHWTLLRFDEPLLITGDQPICPVPLLTPGIGKPIAAIPRDGWLDTCEIRCAFTPRHALLATWYTGPPTDPVSGTWSQAVNLNASVAAQTVEQRFQTPDREPAMPAAILRVPQTVLSPISIEVLSDYSLDAAMRSRLRHRTAEELQRLIERRDHKTITVVRTSPATRTA